MAASIVTNKYNPLFSYTQFLLRPKGSRIVLKIYYFFVKVRLSYLHLDD